MSFRYALKVYIEKPELFPNDILYEDEDFVVMKDKFPKALYHYLVLPKDPKISKLNPLIAFQTNPELKEKAKVLIDKFKLEILEKLEKEHDIKESLSFIEAGVHSVPSMYNLHIHIITQDFNSVKMKNKHHYNSFTTQFFVKFDDLPLDKGDKRLNKDEMEKIAKTHDLICVYCSQNFHNRFAVLKKHLTEEFNKRYLQINN